MRSLEVMRLLGWAAGVAACVAAIYLAAGAALHRPDALRIDGAAAASSVPHADYSADDRTITRAQLDPQIIGAIIADEAGSNAESAATNDDTAAADSESGSTRASLIDPAPVADIQPTRTPQPRPTATDTPEPEPTAKHTSEPEPTPTVTQEPEPPPTDTPEPEPTETPKPDPTATRTPAACRPPELGNLKDEPNNGKRRRCPTPTPAFDE